MIPHIVSKNVDQEEPFPGADGVAHSGELVQVHVIGLPEACGAMDFQKAPWWGWCEVRCIYLFIMLGWDGGC